MIENENLIESLVTQNKLKDISTLDLMLSDDIKHSTDKNHCFQEYFDKQLLDFFSIRLSILEESYSSKEIEVSDLMFKLHHITLTSNKIQSNIPKNQLYIQGKIKSSQKDEDLNSSKISIMSRRSSSSSRVNKNDFQHKNTKDKLALYSPKVAINIMFNQEKNSTSDKSSKKKSVEVKSKGVNSYNEQSKQNVNNNTTPASKRTKNQSPINDKEKLDSDEVNLKLQHKLNARKVKSDGENLEKKNMKNTSNNIKNGPYNSHIIKTKTINLKGLNSIEKEKNSKIINSVNIVLDNAVVDKIYNSNNSATKSIITKKESPKNEFIAKQIQSKINFKFEPKKKKKSIVHSKDNFNSQENDISIKYTSKLFSSSLSNILDNNLFGEIIKFFNSKDKLAFKNSSHLFRVIFFKTQINELNNKIKYKKQEENPLFHLVFSKELEIKISEMTLNLSDYLDSYNEVPSFNNLVNILYIIIFKGDGIYFKDKFLHHKIDILEKYIEKKKKIKTKNIFKIFHEIDYNAKNNYQVYQNLNNLYLENPQIFRIIGLSDDFIIFSNYFQLFEDQMNKGCNLEISIDLEIFQHKLEIMKTYLDHVIQ